MDKKFQHFEYSKFNPLVLKTKGRIQIAKQILKILQIYFRRKKFKDFTLLDLGSSSGVICHYLSPYFQKVVGIDVDKKAVQTAKRTFRKKNLDFAVGDACHTNFKDNSFDVIICNQVYYWVNARKLVDEIYRILNLGGVCFFGGVNKFRLWDVQYGLPLVTFLPQSMSSYLVRLTGKADSYETKYKSLWQLLKICKKFKVTRYTPKIMYEPKKYGYTKLVKYTPLTNLLGLNFWKIAEPMMPNFIWVLEKPSH